MRTLSEIRTDIERQSRRLAQAYLYGSESEQKRHKLALVRLSAEERRLMQWRVEPVRFVR